MNAGIAAAISAAFGLAVGSFLNVVIWRVPRRESVVRPPSHCPSCDTPIAPYDNVPVLSWLLLRGHCRRCGAHISARYPFVELVTAVLFAVVGARFASDGVVFALLVLTAALVALSAVDLEHLLLPNRIIYPTAAIGLPLFVLAAAVDGDLSALARAALGAVIAFVVFYAIWFAAPRAMGFGDVRLAALLGFASAYLGWPVLVLALFLPFVLGSVGGIAVAAPIVFAPMALGALLGALTGVDVMSRLGGGVHVSDPARARLTVALGGAVLCGALVYLVLSALRRVERGRHIPFGPFLAAGALLAILIHGPIG
jgi:leader peptidase (prepilin peptidase)/N-methyltransferase